jgi:hypothetical protein
MNQLIFAIIKRLKSNAVLASAVGNKISYRKGEVKDFPYIMIDIITNDIVLATQHHYDVYTTLVQVSIFTDDFYPKRALELQEMVNELLGRECELEFDGSDAWRFIGAWIQSESIPVLVKTSVNASGYWQIITDISFKYAK